MGFSLSPSDWSGADFLGGSGANDLLGMTQPGGINSNGDYARALFDPGDLFGTGAAEDLKNANDEAARLQLEAGRNSLNVIEGQYNQNLQDQMPWITSGTNALNQLNTESNQPYVYEQSPGHAFNQEQGINSINQNAVANRSLFSGANQKNTSRFNQDLYAQDYNQGYQQRQDRLNRLASLANVGQSVSSDVGAQGVQYGATGSSILNNISNNAQTANTNSAAITAASNNNIANTINSGINAYYGGGY